MLSVARLKVLREVAYGGSISAAAHSLSYTQSAISQQIAALESEAGIALLERHPRGISLTAAGQTRKLFPAYSLKRTTCESTRSAGSISFESESVRRVAVDEPIRAA